MEERLAVKHGTLLEGAAPVVVDPGLTALWEMRLDEVVMGRRTSKALSTRFSAEADKLVASLRRHTGALLI